MHCGHTTTIFFAFALSIHTCFFHAITWFGIRWTGTRTWTIWGAIWSHTGMRTQIHVVSYYCKVRFVYLCKYLNKTGLMYCPIIISWSFHTFKLLYHLRENFGLPRMVLCHTTGKLVREQKFCVTATVVSRFNTTCHQPPGTKTVSPGFCRISSCDKPHSLMNGKLRVSIWRDKYRFVFCWPTWALSPRINNFKPGNCFILLFSALLWCQFYQFTRCVCRK